MPTPIRSSGVARDMKISSQRKKDASATAGTRGQCIARKPVSLLREIFGQAILVISGQRRRMYQNGSSVFRCKTSEKPLLSCSLQPGSDAWKTGFLGGKAK